MVTSYSPAVLTVSRHVLQALVAAVESAGASRSEYLQAIGMVEADLDAAGPRLPRRDLIGYCEQALAVAKDPALGLHWGESLEDRAFDPVYRLMAHAGTLRRGLEVWERFELLFHDQPTFEVREDAQAMSIRMTNLEAYSLEIGRFMAEVLTAGMLLLVRRFAKRARPLVSRFAYPAPAYRSEYERVFGVNVLFDQSTTELQFDRALLDQSSPRGDSDIHEALQAVAEQRLLRLTRTTSHAAKLREYLRAQSPKRVSMEEAAKALGTSGRSLRRQLGAEGTTYREIELGVVLAAAKRLLCDMQWTIQETAHEMGFSDAAAFHRAFKSWTGITPSEFRERVDASG